MCEEASCDVNDNPIAVALWKSDRPARLEILCNPQRHRLAAVYDLPADGGLVVCQPRFKAFKDYHEVGDVEHGPDGRAHFHADAFLLSDDEAGNPAGMLGRCRCGTYRYTRTQVGNGLTAPHGRRNGGVPFIFGEYTRSARGRNTPSE